MICNDNSEIPLVTCELSGFELLQKIRCMKFEEVYELRNERRIMVAETARMLFMSEYHLLNAMRKKIWTDDETL